MKSKVYFSSELTPASVLALYEKVAYPLTGRVAVKVHSGEAGNQNFLRPAFWQPMVNAVKGTIVECNTAYPGGRDTTPKHLKLLENHGWNELFDVDLLDAEGPDMELDIPNGKRIMWASTWRTMTVCWC